MRYHCLTLAFIVSIIPLQGRGSEESAEVNPTNRSIRRPWRVDYRNSADRNGVAPYVLLDRGGVVRGYVTPSEGLDLQAYCGRPVTLVGSISPSRRDQPPRLVAEHVLDTAARSSASYPLRAGIGAAPARSGGSPSGFPRAHGIRPKGRFGGPHTCRWSPPTIGHTTRTIECDWTARFATICGGRHDFGTGRRCATTCGSEGLLRAVWRLLPAATMRALGPHRFPSLVEISMGCTFPPW